MNRIIITILSLLVVLQSFAQTGIITTIAGGGSSSGYSGDGGLATAASNGGGSGPILIAPNGDYYFAVRFQDRVRKVSATGIITTFAGTGTRGFGGDGGPATAAMLNNPSGLAIDTSGNIYISEIEGSRVRKVDARTNTITTIAGNGVMNIERGIGGPATAAAIASPFSLTYCPPNDLYLYNATGNVLKVDLSTGIVSSFAGTGYRGFSGDGGPASTAQLNGEHITSNPAHDKLILSEWYSGRIREISLASGIVTTVAGTGSVIYNGEGLPATLANLATYCTVIDSGGNMIIGGHRGRIRKIDAATGNVYTIVGYDTVLGFSGDGGRPDSARISAVQGLAVDACNNLYFSDSHNRRIRKITYPAGNQPTITITSQGGNTLCYPMPITFTAHTTLAGWAPTYEWRVNGAVVGGSTPTYTYTPAAGDSINCILTSNLYCVVNPKDTSNTLRMNVFSLTPPTLSLSGTSGAAIGDTVTITAAVAATGLTSYSITWENKGTVIATTFTPTLRYVKAAGDDTLTATLVSTSRNCYDSVVSAVHIVRANVGVNNLSNGESIALWPNPTSGTLHYSGLAAGSNTTIAFYDLVGRQLIQTTTNTSNGTLNITTLPTGIYIAQITDVATGLRVVRRVSVR